VLVPWEKPKRTTSQYLDCVSTMGSIAESAPLGKEFTQKVVDAMGPNTPPRLREIMSSLIRHLHEFTIETQLTTDEWMLGVNTINWAGQMSDDKRNEGQLMCDVLGIES
jgi:catechol 1,2-dioxygenase